MSQQVQIGELTFEIDETKGTQTERDQMYETLQFLSKLPKVTELFSGAGMDHSISGGVVNVIVSSDTMEASNPAEVTDLSFSHATPYDGNIKLTAATVKINPDLIDKTQYYSPEDSAWHEYNVPEVLMNELGNIASAVNKDLDIPGGPGSNNNTVWGYPLGSDPNNPDSADWNNNAGPSEQFSAETEDVLHDLFDQPARETEYDTGTGLDGGGTTRTNDSSDSDYDPMNPWDIKTGSDSGNRDIWGTPQELVNALEKAKLDAGAAGEPSFIQDVMDFFGAAIEKFSPLVLDLDDSGTIELVSLANSQTYWDIDVDGFAETSGWVTGGDGLLARDVNDNGRIDDNSELFGSGTMDGFTALSALDSTGDGVIDASDTDFGDLLVWVDENENGYSEAAELFTLADLDIISLDLGATEVDLTNEGHSISHTSTFTVDDGVNPPDARIVHDVWFEHDNVNTVFVGDYTLDFDALSLPDLRGYGTLPDLFIAMSQDNTGTGNLLDLVDTLNDKTFTELFADDANPLAEITEILYRWAGVDGLTGDERGANIDARNLGFLEGLMGQDFLQRGWNPDPFVDAARDMREAYHTAQNNFYARIISQTSGSDLFTGDVGYDITDDAVTGITGLNHTKISDLGTEAASAADKAAYWENVVRLVEYTIGVNNLISGDYTALDDEINDSDVTLSLSIITANIGFENDTGDFLQGDANNNTITGGNGHDTIEGKDGNDTLTGGSGDDTIRGEDDNDTLTGGFGSDFLLGGAGDDTYVFATGEAFDTIREKGNGGADKILFGLGIELDDLTMTRVSSTDMLIEIDPSAGGGSIVIEDYFNHSTGTTGAGHVETIEFNDASTYDLDSQAWTLTGTDGNDYLTGVEVGGLTTDTIYGGAGSDTIYADSGDDIIYGGGDNDKLYGEAGNDTIYGDDGNDAIYAYTGNDTIYTGTGDDKVYTGSGDDTVHYESGDLFISEFGFGGGSGGTDVIEMASSFVPVDLSFYKVDDDLIITVDGGGTITIHYHYSSASDAFETIAFADLSTIDLSTITLTITGTESGELLTGAANINDTIFGLGGNDDLLGYTGDDKLYGGDGNDTLNGGTGASGDDRLYGDDGNDTLYGYAGADFLQGGAGNDTIYSGAGDDVVLYDSGTDIVQEYVGGSNGGTDVLEMADGIVEGDLSFARYKTAIDDLVITVAGQGTITIADQYYSAAYAFETIRFADTSTLSFSAITAPIYGTESGETVNGDNGVDDIIYGLGGNDSITGYSGNDMLYGGDGNDSIYGYAGDDLLDGGAGDDTLQDTTSGDDIYVYESGLDSVYDYNGTADVLRLTGSTTINDIVINDLGSHHEIIIDSGVNEIELKWFDYSAAYKIETIEFDDGFTTTLSDHPNWYTGSASGETLSGNSSHNTLIGYAGNDTLNGNDGADDLHGGADADTLNGGNGDDLLHGGAGDDDLYGNDGLDTLYGGAGADVFFFESASAYNDIDVIKDFNVADSDAIDISDLLSAYDPMTDAIADFVSFSNDGNGNSELYVDQDGTGGTYSMSQIALLEGNIDLDAGTLETNSNLITV
ncbi:MAG: hypothetical protein NPIRA01_09910 [Nitrospirales bacterium]|nr:MAG: hypothetical protein NPIRA01_09910 [Nitrospirales bacterium]